MAAKKEKTETTVREDMSEPVSGEDITENAGQKFRLDTLKRDCLKLYGVTSSTFAGATCDVPEGEYTIDEIGSRIKAWLGKEAK